MVAVALTLVATSCGTGDTATDGGCDGEATGPGAVAGIDLATGEQTWAATVGRPGGAMVAGGVLVVSAEASVVRGFDAGSGELRWCVDLAPSPLEIVDGFAEAGGVAVTFSGGDVIALDPVTGDERWRHEASASATSLAGGEFVRVHDGSAAGPPIEVLDPSSGDVVDDAPPAADTVTHFGIGAPPHGLDGWTITTGPSGTNGQEMVLAVAREGVEAWRADVPGFVAAIVPSTEGPVVLVIDQTGGTGREIGPSADTRLTAYAAHGGSRMWQISLPGTPHLVAPVDEHLTIVPVGLELHGVDPATGTTEWVATHDNPGRVGSYDLPGSFSFVADGGDAANAAVGVMLAEQEYRD